MELSIFRHLQIDCVINVRCKEMLVGSGAPIFVYIRLEDILISLHFLEKPPPK
jgi:hypothetical protein